MAIPFEGGRAQRPARENIRAAQHLLNPVLQFATMVAATLAAHQASRKLEGLDDGALKDLGVPRGGIEAMVRLGRKEGD